MSKALSNVHPEVFFNCTGNELTTHTTLAAKNAKNNKEQVFLEASPKPGDRAIIEMVSWSKNLRMLALKNQFEQWGHGKGDKAGSFVAARVADPFVRCRLPAGSDETQQD